MGSNRNPKQCGAKQAPGSSSTSIYLLEVVRYSNPSLQYTL